MCVLYHIGFEQPCGRPQDPAFGNGLFDKQSIHHSANFLPSLRRKTDLQDCPRPRLITTVNIHHQPHFCQRMLAVRIDPHGFLLLRFHTFILHSRREILRGDLQQRSGVAGKVAERQLPPGIKSPRTRRRALRTNSAPTTIMPMEIVWEIENGPTAARGSPRRISMPKRITA